METTEYHWKDLQVSIAGKPIDFESDMEMVILDNKIPDHIPNYLNSKPNEFEYYYRRGKFYYFRNDIGAKFAVELEEKPPLTYGDKMELNITIE